MLGLGKGKAALELWKVKQLWKLGKGKADLGLWNVRQLWRVGVGRGR